MPSPKTSSVTPWRSSLWERPSWMSDSSEWLSMLTKPGATARPVASISSRPLPRTRADGDEAVTVDGDVADDRVAAAAVVDGAVPDHHVVRRAAAQGPDNEHHDSP